MRSSAPSRGSEQVRHGPTVATVVGEGPPLLLLHGLAASARWWQPNIPALARSFRVTAIDLPGFGTSHRMAHFVLREVPGQVVRAMDELGIERASIIGHSMGGLVAGGIAADYPDRVERLVLVDAGFLSLSPGWTARVLGPARAVRWVSPRMARAFVEDVARSGLVRLLEATVEVLRADWKEKLPRITAPTLVVWGERDTICPLRIGERIVSLVPDARLLVMRNAAHNPMWERHEEFDREVLAFLTGDATGDAVTVRGVPGS
jgi:pimeloyl-ACP methyl ester carboxylesterase